MPTKATLRYERSSDGSTSYEVSIEAPSEEEIPRSTLLHLLEGLTSLYPSPLEPSEIHVESVDIGQLQQDRGFAGPLGSAGNVQEAGYDNPAAEIGRASCRER